MGCVSSTFLDNDSDNVHIISHHHIVSLTSTTYGLLTSFDPLKSPDTSKPSDPADSKSGGGDDNNTVVLYTTTLRTIRRTFEDCNAIRSVLRALNVAFKERDISMDLGFREELSGLVKGVNVPQLFVRGRWVGGFEAVMGMSEEGGLVGLMEGVPRVGVRGVCDGCGGVGFLNCFACCGSRKVVVGGGKGKGKGGGRVVRCGECNENGLVLCPICS